MSQRTNADIGGVKRLVLWTGITVCDERLAFQTAPGDVVGSTQMLKSRVGDEWNKASTINGTFAPVHEPSKNNGNVFLCKEAYIMR